jgi:PAS domain S-box-containing protein
MNGTSSLSSIIMKNSPAGIIVIDAATQLIVDINASACFMLGVRDDEIIGTACCEWICSKKDTCPIAKGLTEILVDNEEVTITRKDGSVVYLLCSATGIFWENRLLLVETLIDRTEKKRIENNYMDLVKYAPTGIYEIDLKTYTFTDVNDLMLIISGYTEQEFKAISPFDLLSENSKQIFIDRLRHLSVGEEVPPTVEYEIICKDGSIIWALLNARYIYEKGSVAPSKAFCIITDITARKKAEMEVIDAKNKAQMYLDLAHSMFLALDTNGKIVLINKAGCDILAIDECFLLGKDWFDNYIPIEERKKVRDHFNASIKNNDFTSISNFENYILNSKGERRLIKFKNKVIVDKNGKCIGSFSSGEDITEERRLEDTAKSLWREVETKMDTALKDLKGLPVTGLSTKDILKRQSDLSKTLLNMISIKS